jgi:beta-aspartyl-peptidase (threonine type)
LDHGDAVGERKIGTVGAVARDSQGNLAAATSTGGIVNKRFGRVGDTPVIGAGTYADNETCAVSGTGFGEQFIRTTLGKTIGDLILYKNLTAVEAAQEGVRYLLQKVRGLGGVIVVDKNGVIGIAHSTPGIACAFSRPDGSLEVAFEQMKISL